MLLMKLRNVCPAEMINGVNRHMFGAAAVDRLMEEEKRGGAQAALLDLPTDGQSFTLEGYVCGARLHIGREYDSALGVDCYRVIPLPRRAGPPRISREDSVALGGGESFAGVGASDLRQRGSDLRCAAIAFKSNGGRALPRLPPRACAACGAAGAAETCAGCKQARCAKA